MFRTPSLFRASALGLVLIPVYAACADEGGEATPAEPPPTVVPDAQASDDGSSAGDAGDGNDPDAGCDASDINCAPVPITCDNADWCPVQTGLDGRLAFAAIWGSAPNDVWAVGTVGTIAHYDGTSWAATPSGTNQSLQGIWGSSATDIWVTSTPGVILHGTGWQNGSATWTLSAPPIADYATVTASRGKLIPAVWGSSASDVFFGGEAFAPKTSLPSETQWRTAVVDGGAGWQAISGCIRNGSCPAVRSIWGSSASDVWAVGVDGHTRHTDITTTDAGVPTWTVVDSQTSFDFWRVWGSSGSDVWAVGGAGTIRHFVTGATVWQKIESPTKNTLRSMWGSSANDVWAVGELGTIVHFDGTKWTTSTVALPAGAKPHLNGVWGSGPNDVWVVGDGIFLHFTGHKTGISGQ
ncbi:MAG: hypothetical protein K0S65_739 [Labilithrix sp.]|nr:hypothetical protein [Labilithrix sp.]